MQEDIKKNIFLVIDGSAMLHRAYHAMPPLTTPEGTPTGAVHGFFSMLLKLYLHLNPSHIAVAFDRPKPTFRQDLYKEYQANRPTMFSELSVQFDIVQKILEEAEIPVYFSDGFEADDIIGTLCEAAKKIGDVSYVVTGDRDMMQLVNGRTKILMPIKGISEMKLFDEKRVKEQFGVLPKQIIELKALTGDASDNYPGVSGIGPKTAIRLIEKYKTVKKIYNNLSEIKKEDPKLAEKLDKGKKNAFLSHQLASILLNVPFEYSFKDCETKNISYEKWRRAFEKYEFKTLPKRLDEVFGKIKSEKSSEQSEIKNSSSQMKLF